MNFKTPFKVLTTAALIGTLSLSAVAPGAASAAEKTVTAQAETPANFAIEKVILVKGDSKISVSFDTYIDALGNEKALNGYELAYVVAANGEVFALDTYVDFYEEGNTEKEVVEKLSKAGKTSEVTEVKDGSFNDGKLEPVEDTAATAKVDLEKAVAAAKATEIKDAAAKAELTKAIEAAEKAAAKEDATKEELEAAKAELTKAVEAAKKADAEAALEAKVESVKAINAKEIEVKFNKEINASTLLTGSADTAGLKALVLNSVTVTRTVAAVVPNTAQNVTVANLKGKISEDGKTLTIVLGKNSTTAEEYLNGTYAVTVADSVKAKDGKEIKAYAGTFTFEDKVVPTVSEVTYNTVDNKVKVTFSEQLAAKPSVLRVNGEVVAASAITLQPDGKSVTFAKPTAVEAGSTASVYVAGATDVAGNILTPFTGDVTIAKDTSALKVESIEQTSSNTAKLVFSKSLDAASIAKLTTAVTTGDVLTVLNKGAKLAVTTDFTVAQDTTDTTNKTFTITFTGTGTAPDYTVYGDDTKASITAVLADKSLTDVFGQKLASETKTFDLTKDVQGPKVVSSKIVNGTIEVTFDENIAATGDVSKIVLRKDGIALSTADSAAQKGATGEDAKVLVITPATADLVSGKLPAGSYTVRLNEDAIKDAHGNKNAVQNTNVSQAAAAEKDLVATIAPNGSNKFFVTYKVDSVAQEVTAATALDAKNYTLDGKALPEGTDIYFADSTKSKVAIDLPANSINIGSSVTAATANLAVSGVKTEAGKTVVATSGVVNVADNTPAVLKSASLVAPTVLKVTFDEDLTTTPLTDVDAVIAALDITSDAGTFAKAATGSGSATATATTSISGKDLIITVTPGDSNWAAVVAGDNLTVKAKAAGALKDKNGVAVKDAVKVTVTK